MIIDTLPELYRTRVSDILTRQVPAETKATCNDCAMCDSARAVPSVDGVDRTFRSNTKCCTYHPRLANYLVGGILATPGEGQRRMREKLAQRVGVTPQWVRPPATYSALYDQAKNAFGRTEALRCPFYEIPTGGCTIWQHRDAVCSTYFCRYEKGEDGYAFYMQLKAYLGLLELQLSRHAVYQLMPEYILQKRDVADPPALSNTDLDAQAPFGYTELWREYVGREEEFYLACHQIIERLTASEVAAILGIDGTLALAVLDRRHQAVATDVLPKRLRFNPNATVHWLPNNVVALGAYSNLDALALDGSAYPLLVAFDGSKTVQEVRAQLRTEKQADLSDDVLLTLYRHRILTT